GMLGLYDRLLALTWRRAWIMALTPLLLVVATHFLLGAVRGGFFPPQDTGLIAGRASAGTTLSFADMQQRQQRLTELLMADPAVELVGASLGSGRRGTTGQFDV